MSLFKKASQVAKKFKVCAYGPPGSGKTFFALSFPKKAYIDMEHGTDWLIGNGGPDSAEDFDALYTKSASDVIAGIYEIEADITRNPGKYETIVIDPVTLFWDALQDAFIKKMRQKKGQDFEVKFNHWREIKGPYKSAMTTLLNLPLHMVLIGREAVEYDMKKGELVQVGTKMQAEKDTPYVADIYLEMFTELDTKTKTEKFMVKVKKDRTGILKKGTVMENCNYNRLVELRDALGIGTSGEHAVMEDDEEVAARDAQIFEEAGEGSPDGQNEDQLFEVIQDSDVKKLWMELGWTAGKVRAMVEKHSLPHDRTDVGKFLAVEVKKLRAEKREKAGEQQ